MQTTSSIAIAAALALLAMPAFAQDQNAPTTGREIVPPSASTTGGDTTQTGTTAPTGGSTTGTAQTTPSTGTDMNAGTAQTAPSTTPSTDMATSGGSSVEPFVTAQGQDQFLGSNLMGAKVRSAADEDIGDVNDVLFDMQGKATAIVVGVGGFLGIGEKAVAIPLERLTINRPDMNDDDILISLETTKDELNAAPEFRKWQPNATASTSEGVTPTPNATGSTATDPAMGTGTGAGGTGTNP